MSSDNAAAASENATGGLSSELKAAKLKSKETQRLLRAASRNEKRQLKAEAKKERKLNAKRGSKGTDGKLEARKNAENRANPSKEKRERQMLRLKLRAERLKAEGLRMLEDAEPADEDNSHAKKKKSKRDKTKLKEDDRPDIEPAVEEEHSKDKREAKKARKEEKKRKRAAESEVAAAALPAEDTSKEKKRKKSKSKDETADKASAAVEKNPVGTSAGEQWNVSGLDGGASRQDKFMRLLGGKKAGNEGVISTGTSKGKTDSGRSADDLQRQFDYGMKMKHEMGGQKRGLGA